MYTNVNAVSTTTRSLSLTCTDVTNDRGDTPLDLAVQRRHTKVIEYLKSVRTPEPGMCVLY